jgi:uncharacterized protein DUF397
VDNTPAGYQRSSFCSGGNCVEVNIGQGLVTVKDELNRRVHYSYGEWSDFLRGAKRGEFDLPA